MTVDEIYKYIGSCIVDSIEENWISSKLEIESYIDDYVDISGEYITEKNENKWIDIGNSVFNNFEPAVWELQKIMAEGDHNKWNKAIFNLKSDHKFDMEFSWDQTLDDKIKNV